LIVADYEFDHHQQEVQLLRQCAAAAADAHAPFIANASPGFLGSEGPRYAAWESFRSSEDARYVVLCTPGDAGLAGRESHAFAVQVADTFARRRWFDGLTDAASSAQRPKRFADTPEGRALALDSLAGAELRNVLNISRVAHFIEALGRELDVSQGASALEQALQAWLREHVPDARVSISQGDYYRYELELRAASPQSDATLRVAGTLGDA
jgi:predicted component of type VI protein secretion system